MFFYRHIPNLPGWQQGGRSRQVKNFFTHILPAWGMEYHFYQATLIRLLRANGIQEGQFVQGFDFCHDGAFLQTKNSKNFVPGA